MDHFYVKFGDLHRFQILCGKQTNRLKTLPSETAIGMGIQISGGTSKLERTTTAVHAMDADVTHYQYVITFVVVHSYSKHISCHCKGNAQLT